MNRKWSLLAVHRFYNIEQAVELLTNMSDCEVESTSESENEGDSSDSSEDAPVTKPQPVFLYNRYMSSVDLTDQFFTVLQFSA